MTAACSGGAGDLVYAIRTMQILGVKTIFIKENFYRQPFGNLYLAMNRLMQSQGFACKPTSGNYPVGQFDPQLHFDFNIDNFRNQPGRGTVHIMMNMYRHFNIHIGDTWKRPWMTPVPALINESYSAVHVTERWREGSKVDWKSVLRSIPGNKYYVGLQYEWLEFASRYGDIKWFPTDDIFEMAQVIGSADALYCNQSVGLTLAQGLGVPYYLDRKPGKTNTLLYTKNEHLL